MPGLCTKCLPPLIRGDREPRCPSCGARDHKGYCRLCVISPSPFSHLLPLTHYEGLTRQLIREVKYAHKFHLALLLGHFVANQLCTLTKNERYDIIVPVPSALQHLNQRRFSLPAVIARVIARQTGTKYCPMALLANDRQTRGTIRRPLEERIFKPAAITPGPIALHGKSVLLVDDVLTTGTTMETAASCLQSIGAGTIHGLALSISKHYEFNRMLKVCAKLPVKPVIWNAGR